MLGIISAILISCLEEDFSYSETYAQPETILNKNANKNTPENPLNPYDSAGIFHNIYLTEYLDLNFTPLNIQDVMNEVNLLTGLDSSQSIDPTSSHSKIQKIQDILNNPTDEFDNELAQAPLSSAAKDSIASLTDYVNHNDHEEFSVLKSYIEDFEENILSHSGLTEYEKSVVLSYSSVIRHSLYFKKRKRRDDRDWEINVTNRSGAFMGALESPLAAAHWAIVLTACDMHF